MSLAAPFEEGAFQHLVIESGEIATLLKRYIGSAKSTQHKQIPHFTSKVQRKTKSAECSALWYYSFSSGAATIVEINKDY